MRKGERSWDRAGKDDERLMVGSDMSFSVMMFKEQAAIGCKRVFACQKVMREEKALGSWSMCGVLYYPGGRSRLVASITGGC